MVGGASETVGDATTVTIRAKGKASSRSLIPGKEAHRWDPCRTIDYRVNLRQAPPGTLGEVRGALRRVTVQSGLRFRYAGETGVVLAPARGSTRRAPTWCSLGPTGAVQPLPGPGRRLRRCLREPRPRRGRPGRPDAERRVRADRDRGVPEAWTRGSGPGSPTATAAPAGLLMHEIGHAVGMGHADRDRGQVMYPVMQDAPAVWGRDAANLERLGLSAGCIAGPADARTTARRPGTPWSSPTCPDPSPPRPGG